MPDLRPQAPPTDADVLPPPGTWQSTVEHETRRLVELYRPSSDDDEVRRQVLRVVWDVLGMRPPWPDRRTAQERLAAAEHLRLGPARRFLLALACHEMDWSDGRARLGLLAEVVRMLDLELGREAPAAHPGG